MAQDTFRIGGTWEVARLGYGAMRLPTDAGPEREHSIAVLRRAVELGVTLIDTAHMYGWGANEELVAEALHPYPDDLLVTTKVGIARSPETSHGVPDGRPETLREEVDLALRRLRVDRVELLQLHRIDPDIPLADQLGTLRELRDAGKIGLIGLSEVTVEELARAREIVEIASVQNRYNVVDREHEAVLDVCARDGIAFLPWRPVVMGAADAKSELTAIAAELDATATQVSLAWLLGHSPALLPIPGTGSLDHLADNIAATALILPPAQRARLDALATPGHRPPEEP